MVFYCCPGEMGRNRKNFYVKVITFLFVDKQIFRRKKSNVAWEERQSY